MKTEIAVKDVAQAKKAQERMIHRKDGSLIIPIQDGLFDLFQGSGFANHSRFRVVRFRGVEGQTRQLYQVSGSSMSRELREQILKEL